MKFDFKDEDVKSWANRKDVKKGDKGFFFKNFFKLKVSGEVVKGKIRSISSIDANCFYDEKNSAYPFFLPLDVVKEDKPKEKKYKPFKTLAEMAEVINGEECLYYSQPVAGDCIIVKHKYDKHYEKLLVTSLEYDKDYTLIGLNGKSLKALFESYELRNNKGEYVPFGIEVKEDE